MIVSHGLSRHTHSGPRLIHEYLKCVIYRFTACATKPTKQSCSPDDPSSLHLVGMYFVVF